MNPAEPKPQRKAPIAPKHLSEKARRAWKPAAALLEKMGVLTVVDGVALEMLCEAYADHLTAREELEAFGSNYYETTNKDGGVMHRVHPAVGVMQDADRRIKAWLVEFGMTPSARSRVKGDGQPDEDEAEAFFSARK